MAKSKRERIRPLDRFEVFKRDEFTCFYCGRTPPTTILEVDHIVAVAAGGGNEASNLVTSCFECNRGKGARPLTDVPLPLRAMMEEEQERAAQMDQYNEFLMKRRRAATRLVGRLGTRWFDEIYPKGHGYVFGSSRTPSLRRFIAAVERFPPSHDRESGWPEPSRERGAWTRR